MTHGGARMELSPSYGYGHKSGLGRAPGAGLPPAFLERPYSEGEAAWFWVAEAQAMGRRMADRLRLPRPGVEPQDVLRVVDRLYRQRLLHSDHLRVLAFYGRRMSPPQPDRLREQRACSLWREAMETLEPALRSQGII